MLSISFAKKLQQTFILFLLTYNAAICSDAESNDEKRKPKINYNTTVKRVLFSEEVDNQDKTLSRKKPKSDRQEQNPVCHHSINNNLISLVKSMRNDEKIPRGHLAFAKVYTNFFSIQDATIEALIQKCALCISLHCMTATKISDCYTERATILKAILWDLYNKSETRQQKTSNIRLLIIIDRHLIVNRFPELVNKAQIKGYQFYLQRELSNSSTLQDKDVLNLKKLQQELDELINLQNI